MFNPQDHLVHFRASGGTTVTPGNGYKYHVFTSDDNFVVSGASQSCEVLLVGGGGGGGSGGVVKLVVVEPGGVRFYPNLTITAGTYPVVIGQGGNHAPAYTTPERMGVIQPHLVKLRRVVDMSTITIQPLLMVDLVVELVTTLLLELEMLEEMIQMQIQYLKETMVDPGGVVPVKML